MEGRRGRHGTEMLALYEDRLASFQDRLVTTLGKHTVRVLLDRAIRQTAQRHPDITLLHHNAGLSFDALEQSYATRPVEEIAAAFNDLISEMLLILTRLLGGEMAQRLTDELEITDAPNDS